MNNNEGQQKQMQKIINEISHHAIRLYELMEPGMSVDVAFPEVQDIVAPNKPPKVKRLIIIKPRVHLNIQLTPKRGEI